MWSVFFCFLNWLDTDEELMEWKTKFEVRIAILQTKVSKLERKMNVNVSLTVTLKVLSSSKTIDDSIKEISDL